MATSAFRNKNLARPKKTGAARRKRIRDQKRRLVALGAPEAAVAKMNQSDVRELLKRPVRTAKLYAKA